MTEPLVSIVMPAYNAEPYITAAIQSALAQTYGNWELIVVDDGSTDNTAKIARDFLALDTRVEYIFQANAGQGTARNTAIKNARGDLIAFLDADDLWEKEKLALQIKAIKETSADIIFSDGFVFSGDDVSNESRSFRTLAGNYEGREMFRRLFALNRIPLLSALVRKEVLQEAGFFEEHSRYSEDYDLWLRLARGGAIFYGMKDRFVRYRIHANSSSRRKVELLESSLTVLKKYCEDEKLDRQEVKKRFRELHRALIGALLERNMIREAKECARESAVWEKHESLRFFHLALIRLAPRWYEAISGRAYKLCGAVESYVATSRHHSASR